MLSSKFSSLKEWTKLSTILTNDSVIFVSKLVSNLAIKLPQALVKFFMDISINPANVLAILRDFRALVSSALQLNLPLCKNVQSWEPFGEDAVEEPEMQQEAETVAVAQM